LAGPGERQAIAATKTPATVTSLTSDLRALGVRAGGVVIVHSSLSRLGWVAGGETAVVAALRSVLGAGTLVMPTHSSELSEPSRWENPPVAESWWPVIRAETPAFDAVRTPTRSMGAVVECFRHEPGVMRSDHPRHSFAALGPHAPTIVAEHDLADSFGERSPLARCYELDAQVLLLGVGHANNTSLHLAETRARYAKRYVANGSPVMRGGRREWVAYEELDIDDSDFERLGTAFAATGGQRDGAVGTGRALLMAQRSVVDFAVSWMSTHRP
jgi:aminoglycoside 3-N-acetyltransferase